MKNKIKESHLILPSLIIIAQTDDLISTKSLKKSLKMIVKPTDDDLEIMKGRNKTKFDNKIENLISHKRLLPYASYNKIEGKTYLKINAEGLKKVRKHFRDLERK